MKAPIDKDCETSFGCDSLPISAWAIVNGFELTFAVCKGKTMLLFIVLFFLHHISYEGLSASGPINIIKFKQTLLNDHLFCESDQFNMDSKVSCAAACIRQENFGDCTALRFDTEQEDMKCRCGLAMCHQTSSKPFKEDETMTMINLNCDTSPIGKETNAIKCQSQKLSEL